MISRLLKHLLLPVWWWRSKLSTDALARIEAAVGQSEIGHGGEVRVAVESTLGLGPLLRGTTARERAIEVFANLRVWDTEENNGVLLYVLLADRDVEIVADRGMAGRVTPAEWEAICQAMESLFRANRHEEALSTGARLIGERLSAHFPLGAKAVNQLPDRPVVLK